MLLKPTSELLHNVTLFSEREKRQIQHYSMDKNVERERKDRDRENGKNR